MTHERVDQPATGETIATHDVADAATVDATLDRAVVAQRGWAATSVNTRAAILRALGMALCTDAEALAQVITAEMGKPIVQARGLGTPTTARRCLPTKRSKLTATAPQPCAGNRSTSSMA